MLARPKLSQAQQDVLAAAEYIEKYGHCKNRLKDGKKVCLRGAIAIYGANQYHTDREVKAWDLVLKTFGKTDPIAWNNAPERTAAEVIDKLREIAYNG